MPDTSFVDLNETLQPIPAQLAFLPLNELFVPSWNPRKYIDPVEQANLVAYIEKGGRVLRILVLKRPEGGWWVISGQRRMLAFKELKKSHIEAEIMDITLDEAKILAETSNEGVKPYWLDTYENWETLLDENPDWTGRELARRLGKQQAIVQRASQVLKVLNPASRAAIRESLETQKALFLGSSDTGGVTDAENKEKLWEFNQESARNLIPLLTGRSVVEAQSLAEETVKTILKDRLTASKVKDLVAKASVPRPQAEKQALSVPISPEPEMGTNPRTDSVHTGAQPISGPAESASSNNGSRLVASTQTTSHQMGSAETALYEAVAGVSVIAKIRSKIKKGERPNLFEVCLLAGYNLWHGLVWLVKEGFKWTKLAVKWTFKAIKMIWKLFRESLETFGLYQYVRAVFVLGIVITLLFGGWYIHEHGERGLVHLVYSKIWHPSENPDPIASAPTPVPTSIPTVQPAKVVTVPKKEVKKEQAPVNSQTSLETKAWAPDEETQTNLESEIASLPKNCVVEPLSFQPNTGINGAMAARRLQDLTDPDKYKLLFGHDVQKVMSIDADTTSLNITYQNGLIGFVTGGTSKMDFYWEDVRAIHCCQIESTDQPKGHPLYQCSLVLADAKRPFVIQCPSATNFGRLVSALVFWIQLSANKNVAVTGLPYLNQGLMMNDDRVITQIWAKSPADIAGLKCKDHLWSVGVNTRDPQDKKIILSALQGPSPITLFSVNPANWDKANIEMTMNNSHNFNPKRDKRTVS